MNQEHERTVSLSGMADGDAKGTLQALAGNDIKGVADAVPKFTPVDYYSFKAEYGVVDGNIIIHFFLPSHAKTDSEDARKEWLKYWMERFPDKLDITARTYFEAERPRLVVKYTDELASWFFRAQGYSHLIDIPLFLTKFFELLDGELRKSS